MRRRIPQPADLATHPCETTPAALALKMKWVRLRREPEYAALWIALGLIRWDVIGDACGMLPFMKWRFTFETWCFEVTIDKDDFIDRHEAAWRAEPEFPEKVAMREAERLIRERAAMVGVAVGPSRVAESLLFVIDEGRDLA